MWGTINAFRDLAFYDFLFSFFTKANMQNDSRQKKWKKTFKFWKKDISLHNFTYQIKVEIIRGQLDDVDFH